jgi:RNA polymerase sigma factor (sigma-70 family)
LEASALTHASRRGLLTRPARLLRLQKDDRLIALMRGGHERAFEVLFERYNARLLAFCQHMVGSREDAEDVLQEVFVAAHHAILGDDRALNVRPWLYRIARNRCLNHLRKPVPEGQDSMDVHPHENGASTAERVQNREEFRRLLSDVQTLPETQRTALLLREVDAMSYEEIAQAMDTTVPSVKSLLVRARITLAESSQARMLTCGEVQLELAEAAEGLRKVSGPVRQHLRSCDGCSDFRSQLRSNSRALAALFPVGPLVALKELFGAKLASLLGGGSSGGVAAGGGAAAGGATAGAGAATAGAGAAIGGAAAGGASGIGGALVGGVGAKAAAGVATAALLTAGAVGVKKHYGGERGSQRAADVPAAVSHADPSHHAARAAEHPKPVAEEPALSEPAETPSPTPTTDQEEAPAPAPESPSEEQLATPPAESEVDESAVEAPHVPIEAGTTGSVIVTPPAEPTVPPAEPTVPPPLTSPSDQSELDEPPTY